MQQLADDTAKASLSAADLVRDDMWDLRQSLETLFSRIRTLPRENTTLQNIFFPSMNLREDAISDPEEETFSWMLEEEVEPATILARTDEAEDKPQSDE